MGVILDGKYEEVFYDRAANVAQAVLGVKLT
jgi:hypothetical protein